MTGLEALELISTLIDGANEYEKKTGNTNPTVYLSKNNLLIIQQSLIKAEKEHNSTNLLMQELDCKDFAELRKYARCGYQTFRNAKGANYDNIIIDEAQEPKQYVDELKLVEKKLKALEIIKEKECDVRWLKFCIKGNAEVETYNSGYPGYRKKLTEEEFDTLKEMLK